MQGGYYQGNPNGRQGGYYQEAQNGPGKGYCQGGPKGYYQQGYYEEPDGGKKGRIGKKKKKQRRAPQQMKKRDLLRKGKQGKVRFSVGKSAGEHQEDENTPCGNQPADDPVTLKGGAQALLYPFFYHFLSVSPCRTSIFMVFIAVT